LNTSGRSRLWLILFLCGWLVVNARVWALSNPTEFSFAEPYFESVGDSELIPYGVAMALKQDARGLIWIATQAGLIRYDGYRLRKFVHQRDDSSSLPGDFIHCLWPTADGRIWIGTASNGLARYDPASERFENFRHDPKRPGSINPGRIFALAGDVRGGLWIGSDQGLDYMMPGTDHFVHYRHEAGNPASLHDDRVSSLLLDAAGRLWVGTEAGLQRLAADGRHFEAVGGSGAALFGQSVIALFQAKDGKIWFGTRKNGAGWIEPGAQGSPQLHQLHQLLPGKNDPAALSHGRVTSIIQPRPDQLWLGTYGGGINVVAAADGKIIKQIRRDVAFPGSLAMDNIGSMLIDHAGLIWIGTWGSGLQRHYDNRAFRLLRHSPTRPQLLSHADVSSMLELANGQLLVGSAANGIDVFERQRGLVGGYRTRPGSLPSLPDSSVTAIAQTPDGSLWAGTILSGVMRLAPGAGNWQIMPGVPDGQVRRLFVDAAGNLWAATNGGAARWQAGASRFVALPDAAGKPMRANVYSLAQDRKGRVWIGSHVGLWLAEPNRDRMQRVGAEPGQTGALLSPEVRGLLVDRHDRLWADTARGLERLRSFDGKVAQFEHISEMLGRPEMYLGGNMQEDRQGRIWTQWFVLEPEKLRLYPLGRADGLDVGTAWIGSFGKTHDGQLMYGGSQGMVLIDPEQFQPWRFTAPVVPTELKINGKPVPLGKLQPELSLAPEQRNFVIEFSALDFSAPQKNRYRYRLQSYDKDWIEADAEHRSASYGNLWPGVYKLQVRGSNRLGEFSDQGLNVTIRVLPAFWQTAWFVVLLLLALGALVLAGYRWRLARLQAEALEMQKLIAARTADILKLGKIGQELTATLDNEQAFERIHKHIKARLDAYVFMIGLLDEEQQRIVFVYEIENSTRQPVSSQGLYEVDRPAPWCVRERRELITATRHDLLNYLGAILPPSSGAPMQTLVYLPLMVEQQVIGCLTVQSPHQHAYGKDQLEFLRVLASYTAIAVSNSVAHGKLAAAHQHLQETQTKLIESEKMASLGGLVSGIAHEINTPLGTALVAISGAAETWQRLRAAIATGRLSKTQLEATTQEGVEYTSLALRTAGRAAELVTIFKSVSLKPESDKAIEVDLYPYLQEATTMLREDLLHRGCRLAISVDPGLHAWFVPDALTEVLNSVFANALDHAFVEGRTGLLRVTAHAAADDGVLLEVADNGVGIAATDVPKVFDPFFTTRGGNLHHVGLGLYVAYNHVTQRLHGSISLSSTFGQGTVVTIVLKGKQVWQVPGH
jgi:ligand-binding sensor domain-containing protein/signal transduction histidine kinase